jgi:hypothetical protein
LPLSRFATRWAERIVAAHNHERPDDERAS